MIWQCLLITCEGHTGTEVPSSFKKRKGKKIHPLTLYALKAVMWSLFCDRNSFLVASAASLSSNEEMKKDLCDRIAAIVNAESTQQKIAPNNISFPIRTSTGNAAKCLPNGVRLLWESNAPTFWSRIIEDCTTSGGGGSITPATYSEKTN